MKEEKKIELQNVKRIYETLTGIFANNLAIV